MYESERNISLDQIDESMCGATQRVKKKDEKNNAHIFCPDPPSVKTL